MDEPGIIQVEESVAAALPATGAHLHVTIQGENFFYGRAALEKSREVKRLVEQVLALGLGPEDVHVQSVTLAGKSGIWASTSSASYALVFHVDDLERLPELLGAIASSKNATMDRLEWRYEEETLRLELTQRAARAALRKAEAIAEVLGVRIASVKRISDHHAVQEAPTFRLGVAPAMAPMRGRADAAADIGASFSSERELTVRVMAEFTLDRPSRPG